MSQMVHTTDMTRYTGLAGLAARADTARAIINSADTDREALLAALDQADPEHAEAVRAVLPLFS